MNCKKCGKELKKQANYCGACGASNISGNRDAQGRRSGMGPKASRMASFVLLAAGLIGLAGNVLLARGGVYAANTNAALAANVLMILLIATGAMLLKLYTQSIAVLKARRLPIEQGQAACKRCTLPVDTGDQYCAYCGKKV